MTKTKTKMQPAAQAAPSLESIVDKGWALKQEIAAKTEELEGVKVLLRAAAQEKRGLGEVTTVLSGNEGAAVVTFAKSTTIKKGCESEALKLLKPLGLVTTQTKVVPVEDYEIRLSARSAAEKIHAAQIVEVKEKTPAVELNSKAKAEADEKKRKAKAA